MLHKQYINIIGHLWMFFVTLDRCEDENMFSIGDTLKNRYALSETSKIHNNAE